MIPIVKQAVPFKVKRALHRATGAFSSIGVRVFSTNAQLASIYYCFFSRSFDREHLAVLQGRAAYDRALVEINQTSPLLRRNIHRLEKGLIMRPRRDVFGEAFILETVRCYNQAKGRPNYSENELRWAGDVLDEYFSVVGETRATVEARLEYRSPEEENLRSRSPESGVCKPYPLSDCPVNVVSFEQLSKLFLRRRSVRWYQQKPVPEGLIQSAINSAAMAPSACNRLPYRFIVANNPDSASKIASCAGGTTGFAEQLPAVIAVIGDLSAYPKERDRHLIYIDASLASMQLMLAAETLGLSTCPINWPDVDVSERKLQGILGLSAHERAVMLISIGYGDPESGIPYSQKKQDELITQWYSAK